MSVLAWIAVGVVVLFVYLIVLGMRAGPRELDSMQLARAVTVRKATAGTTGDVWSNLGSRTTADSMRLKFDHDDDPQAEATFLADPSKPEKRNTLSNMHTVRLAKDFETHHVHTRGYVFRARLRGTEPVVGKEVRLLMKVNGNGTPHGGGVENDDDIDAAIGGWIEFEELEILKVR